MERTNPIISGTVIFDGDHMSISGVRIDKRDEDGCFQNYNIIFKPESEKGSSEIPFQWPYSEDGEQVTVLFSMADGFATQTVGSVCFIIKGTERINFKVKFPSPFRS